MRGRPTEGMESQDHAPPSKDQDTVTRDKEEEDGPDQADSTKRDGITSDSRPVPPSGAEIPTPGQGKMQGQSSKVHMPSDWVRKTRREKNQDGANRPHNSNCLHHHSTTHAMAH